MSEFIMGLGISVKICSLYEELVCLTICNSEHTDEYYKNIELLRKYIEDETNTYDKLSYDDIDIYFTRIREEDTSLFDSVKSRYYSKLKERKDIFDDNVLYEYPFTLDTAISGKILLEALVKVEKQFLDKDGNVIQDEVIYDLYSYHKAHRFTLLSSNDFLERLAVDFDFNICEIPNISFDKIKSNFKCDNSFNNSLNKTLYLMGIEIINTLINDNNERDVYNVYSNMLYLSELEVILNYLDKLYLDRLVNYCKIININYFNKGKYVNSLLRKYRVK